MVKTKTNVSEILWKLWVEIKTRHVEGAKMELSLKGWERNISKRKSINKNIRFCFAVAALESLV
jgi:hypothetical protein